MVNKGRAALAAGVIVAAFALVLGFSSAPATSATKNKTKIVVVSTSPAQPTSGQTYTMRFEIQKLGVAFPMKSVGCYGTVGGRLAKLLSQGTDGTVGHCSWAIPAGSSGKTLDGIAAAQRDTGTWYYLGFDLPIS